MRIGLFWWRYPAQVRGDGRAGHLGWLAGVCLLALGLVLATGAGQAQAAAAVPTASASLTFTAPNYKGVIGGPPGTKTTIHGASWLAYSSVALSLTDQSKSCDGAVSIGTFPTTSTGSVVANFNWPAEANQVGAYYACGTQDNKGTFISHTSFSLLSSSPASLSFTPTTAAAGDKITLSGSGWLPAPQTVNIVVVPCNSLCAQPPVAQLEVVTNNDGTFSQSVTISASAATAGYYIQAANSLAAIAATAGPLQVTGQAAPGGTPSASPHATQGGVPPPPSNTKAALKDALLAGALGLLALLVLISVVVFFLTRARRGPDLSLASNQSQEPDDWDGWSAEDRPYSRPAADASPYRDMPQLPPKRRDLDQSWDDEEQPQPASANFSAVPAYEEDYPWTKSAETRDMTPQPPTDDETYLSYLPRIQRRPRRPGVPPNTLPPGRPPDR